MTMDQLTPSAFANTSPSGLGVPDHILAGRSGQTVFEVSNTTTEIYFAPPYLQQLLDFHTRYPTNVALAQTDGWKPPEAYLGEDFWDGWKHLVTFSQQGPGTVPTGLLDLCVWVCKRYGFELVVNDNRVRPEEGIPDIFEELVDRDYQLEAVRLALEHGRGVLDMVPRAGKTRVMAEIHRRIALPTVWIAPTKTICKNTARVIEGFFGKNYVDVVVGTKGWRAQAHLRVLVCTAATARELPPEFFATREMLAIDEFHHAAAVTYHDIVAKCPHIFYRFGMTGTFFRSGEDAIAMHAVLSKTLIKVDARQLLDAGHLVKTAVCFLPVDGPKAKGGQTFATGCGKNGIWEHTYRTELAAHAAETLRYYGRKVLVLVGTKAQGRAIEELLCHKFPRRPTGKQPVEFVSTDRPARVCQEVIDCFVQTDAVEILIGTSMLGEGVDLPSTDACVYCPGQKAEVPLVQAAYRVCTAMEGKTDAIFVDFADRHHRTLMEHSLERLKVFWGEATFDVEVLPDATFFGEWVAKRAP